jgi:inhibitor of KinA
VPAGSVAIATTQSSIYTLESPGGWHLIGRTPLLLWDRRRDPPAVLAAGDRIAFHPISLDEYGALASLSAAGELHLEPEEAGDGQGPGADDQ